MTAMFRAFRHRNYRLFFGGQSISLIGTWMQSVAMSWLAYQLTHSKSLLGVLSLVSLLPAFFISPLAGVWLDQWDRRKLLITTQTLAGIEAAILAVLVFTNTIQVWHIIVLSIMMGIVMAFDMPGRQSFLVEIVPERDDLGNAIALNSSQFNVARLIGPAVAGAVIGIAGEKVCFLANAISYIAVIGALLMIVVPRKSKEIKERSVLKDMLEGWQYTSRFGTIKSLLVLLGLVSFSSGMYSVLMPAFAQDFFHGNAQTLVWLYSATGLGALAGAVLLAARKSVAGLGTLAFRSALLFGLGTIVFGLMRSLPLALVMLVASGWGGMVNMAATNTLLQSLIEERMRGRVMSFYAMSFMGTMPVGAFIGGALGDAVGLQATCVIAGVFSVGGAIWFYGRLPNIRAEARPMLQRNGTLPTPEAVRGSGS